MKCGEWTEATPSDHQGQESQDGKAENTKNSKDRFGIYFKNH